MENQTAASARGRRVLQRIIAVVVVLACLAGVRLLLGTRQMMYLAARDIARIEVTITPPGTTLTATGDDTAEAVKVLSKTVCYAPQKDEVAGQTVALTIYKHDGTTMAVTSCGDFLTIDGKWYRARLSDGEKLSDWAQALAEKQNIQS